MDVFEVGLFIFVIGAAVSNTYKMGQVEQALKDLPCNRKTKCHK